MILTTQHVSFSYGPPASPKRLREGGREGGFGLRDVSLSVARGSLTGILGPNGCSPASHVRTKAMFCSRDDRCERSAAATWRAASRWSRRRRIRRSITRRSKWR
jgi:ABC-type Na+ transport system ATPase subunit NatA